MLTTRSMVKVVLITCIASSESLFKCGSLDIMPSTSLTISSGSLGGAGKNFGARV